MASDNLTGVQKPATILIVDDQPEVLEVYSRALKVVGYETQVAETAEAALELIAAAVPAAILLDLKMPYVNGLGFLYRLREMHPLLPVAIVTGLATVDDTTLEEIRTLGAEVRYKRLPIIDVQAVVRDLLKPGVFG